MTRALVLVSRGNLEVHDVDKPIPGEGEVLIKVHAAALNPTDVKHIDGGYEHVEWGNVSGCDLAGVIEAIGPGVPASLRSVGDRVAAVVHGASSKNSGAFAEYAVANAHLVISIPDYLSFEDAAGIALCAITACQMLWESQALPSPWRPAATADPKTILVWSGASTVGQYAIQIARDVGLDVISTASPKHWARLTSIGASATFDYQDPEVPAKIKACAREGLISALDCVSVRESLFKIAEILQPGSSVSIIQPIDVAGLRTDLQVTRSSVYTVFGKDTRTPYPSTGNAGHYGSAVKYSNYISELLLQGKLRPLPTRDFQGLDGVFSGIDYMRSGKVSGEKIVSRLS